MSFRTYLDNYRKKTELKLSFQEILKGMKELFRYNYVHRDLKPENIVLNLNPLEVRLIDFEKCTLMSDIRCGNVKGTVGYMPFKSDLRDGSKEWDLFAYVAMLAEADMPRRAYYGV